ncbi:hypothetical protein RSOLAG22IIIB_08330 [Rhizoctonia solani]|uniref:Uncharacterized protein n=1 Tax=Rhizoctonia solani TaxID=456999 RepID=A0A0K6FT68_9AGAM|nr:hypothetical protein RSOLAG22IIIB_08330 [Rhizoctonia solani]
MPYAYATGETRVWTARDERELRADHKRATRATRKHLLELQAQATATARTEKNKPQGAEERTLMVKLLRRCNTGSLNDREANRQVTTPNPSLDQRSPKPSRIQENNSRWWSCRKRHVSSPSSRTTGTVQREPYTPLGVANRTLPRPPIPPRPSIPPQPPVPPLPPITLRPDLVSPPDRVRRKSEDDAATRRRARDRALYHLQYDHDIRRFVVLDNPDDPPIQLKPGTWIPGQINAVDFTREVIAADKRVDVDEFGGLTTPQLIERFPIPPRSLPPRKLPPHGPLPSLPLGPAYKQLPPTRPLDILPRRRQHDDRNIPVIPVPPEPEKSNRDSFFELRRKRSYRI